MKSHLRKMNCNLLILSGLFLCLAFASTKANNFTTNSLSEGINCDDGLIVPIWRPYENLTIGDRVGRGVLYTLLMVYLFIGVSIVSDRFMESIEMITAQEKEVTIKDQKTGKNHVVIVKVKKYA
jgi:hypothetical protein